MKLMPSRKSQKPGDQVKAFRKAARALGADESEANFDAALKKVARHSPPTKSPSDKTDSRQAGKEKNG